jgi:hypothetical protein
MQVYNRSRLNTLLNALQGNVHVSSFTLDLNGLLDQNFNCASLCHYLNESKLLRSVTITCKRTLGFAGLLGRLVRALIGNSNRIKQTILLITGGSEAAPCVSVLALPRTEGAAAGVAVLVISVAAAFEETSLWYSRQSRSEIVRMAFCGDVAVQHWNEDLLAFIQSKTQSRRRLSIDSACWTFASVPWTNELGEAIGSLEALECFAMVQ